MTREQQQNELQNLKNQGSASSVMLYPLLTSIVNSISGYNTDVDMLTPAVFGGLAPVEYIGDEPFSIIMPANRLVRTFVNMEDYMLIQHGSSGSDEFAFYMLVTAEPNKKTGKLRLSLYEVNYLLPKMPVFIQKTNSNVSSSQPQTLQCTFYSINEHYQGYEVPNVKQELFRTTDDVTNLLKYATKEMFADELVAENAYILVNGELCRVTPDSSGSLKPGTVYASLPPEYTPNSFEPINFDGRYQTLPRQWYITPSGDTNTLGGEVLNINLLESKSPFYIVDNFMLLGGEEDMFNGATMSDGYTFSKWGLTTSLMQTTYQRKNKVRKRVTNEGVQIKIGKEINDLSIL